MRLAVEVGRIAVATVVTASTTTAATIAGNALIATMATTTTKKTVNIYLLIRHSLIDSYHCTAILGRILSHRSACLGQFNQVGCS